MVLETHKIITNNQKKKYYRIMSIELIREGFNIDNVIMKDSDTQDVYWSSNEFDFALQEQEIYVKEQILKSQAATKVIVFSSKQILKKLIMVQKAYLHGQLVEEFKFQLGFVMPNTVNTWEQTIVNRPQEQMIPKEIQSGNLVVQIEFFENDQLIVSTSMKVFYI
ncbi:hypothetical protein pb186bvf_013014 [Paramecium bursaria]